MTQMIILQIMTWILDTGRNIVLKQVHLEVIIRVQRKATGS